MSQVDLSPAIVDFGSGYIKAGLASMPEPSIIEPAAVGYLDSKYWFGYACKTEAFGAEGLKMMNRSKLIFPHVKATDSRNSLETIYMSTFYNRLRVDLDERPIFLTEPLDASAQDREFIAQMAFESLTALGMCLTQAPYAALVASGRSAGLVIDCGHDSTSSAFYLEGQTRSKNVIYGKAISGKSMTEYLLGKLRTVEGIELSKVDDLFSVDQIKQKHCHVPISIDEDAQSASEAVLASLQLAPKEKQVSITPELQRIGEALFNPSVIGSTQVSVPDLIVESISNLDEEHQLLAWSNIVLTGGTAMLPGFKHRLEAELKKIVPSKYAGVLNLKLVDNPQSAAWMGNRALALSESPKIVERTDYEERGSFQSFSYWIDPSFRSGSHRRIHQQSR
eukprot:TRINITY_DN12311_c0_g1_i1.p1 TRINITY_DN12311_c0_g1~~TRINITY_DN12311_c0_g1_i1.p1  ORF type:complete len:393 (-),score=77.45 TRINITY_DN12311_c0_g1_i1:314-1492(-)